jgi:DNA-binding transcriptional MocR family regulator
MTIYTPILDRSKPLYLAIADAITTDVESGTLPSGVRLPPQRDLAWRIGVTLGTVTRAYKEVEQRGLLAGEVGRGSYVKSTQRATAIPTPVSEIEGIIDLSHAIPPPVITADEFDAAITYVMREPRRLDLLDYAPPEGFAHHRELGARWLKLSGINVEPSEVVVTAGAHVGLMTVLGAIAEPREAVMAEQVNYALLGATLRNAYLEALPIEMDDQGLVPDAFERAAKSGQSRILYLVPSLQNPTTNTMKRQRREAIVSIARKYNITIIEDDIFRLLDSRTQAPTFYALAPERTFHITGLSKVLAPGLRIGFIATPRGQDRVLKSHVRSAASRSIGVTGEMARYWIETESAQVIMTRIRNEFEARRNLFLDVFKGCTFRCEQAAPFAWLQLPEWWTAGRFSTVLAGRGVKVTPGNAFQLGPQTSSRYVRVCFGHPQRSFQIRQAFETIHKVMQERNDDDFTPVA